MVGSKAKPYFRQYLPAVTWDVMLVVGIVIGAFASALLSGQFRSTGAPSLWAATFGAVTLQEVLRVNAWAVVIPAAVIFNGAPIRA